MSEDMHIRMELRLRDFICGVAVEVKMPPSTAARAMLRDWLRLGQKGAAEAIRQLELDADARSGEGDSETP